MNQNPEAGADASPRAAPAAMLALEWTNRLLARSQSFVAGRYWVAEVLYAAILFSVLFSGGVDERLSVASGEYWFPAYFQKIEHPLLDVAKINPAGNHEAKLNFRLTVPVILHVLRVPPDQRWVLPVLAACGTAVLLALTCVFAFRVSGDRVCGLYATLAVSATYIGSFGFTMYYDTIALCQIVLAMLPGVSWYWKGLLVFTASFTDERAWLASTFLLVQSLCAAPGKDLRARVPGRDFLAVLSGMAAYILGRLALERFAGLTSPHQGIGPEFILINARFWHAGIWLALKGGWLPVCVAAVWLWRRKQLAALAAFSLGIAACVGSGFLVDDVLRSTAYVFPVFVVSLQVVSANEDARWLRRYCLAAFVISALTGNYNVWRSQITWFMPAAARALYHLLYALIGAGPPVPR